MTESLTQLEEEAILERYMQNAVAIAELQEQNEQLKSFFKGRDAEYPAGTTTERGRFYIKVSSNTRIDDTLAKRILTTSRYNNLSKSVIDPVKARRMLDADTLAKITKAYDNRIEIGVR